MRRVSILLAPLLLLAGYAAGRFTATPAPFVAAKDAFSAGGAEKASAERRAVPRVVRGSVGPGPVETSVDGSGPHPKRLTTPRQMFEEDLHDPFARREVQRPVKGTSTRALAEARESVNRRGPAVQNEADPFRELPSLPSNPPAISIPDSSAPGVGFEEPEVNAVPAFVPTPITAQTEQEEQYLNAALKVFRGLGVTERQAEFEQMIGRMEEQDAASELLRLRTELQQLSEKYPKTGAGKKALEAIQTLPVVDVPESETPASEAPPALPRPLENESIFKPDTEVE